ncbi:MAG TPA: lysoplasmalogenase [Acidimicrobiales bacterium]|nr:lysoplasmalogenase [Acidimicrobiales bacterium]
MAKPKTTALLVLAAVALDPRHDAQRWWFVAALVFCLAGDVFLMLPGDRFVAGLASFLFGHLLFMVGFFAGPGDDNPWILTVVLASNAIALSARPVLRGASQQDQRLRLPVITYMFVIAAMLATSARTGNVFAIAGAAMFVISDTILARHRFVAPWVRGRLATMVTYHAAIGLLVVSLV